LFAFVCFKQRKFFDRLRKHQILYYSCLKKIIRGGKLFSSAVIATVRDVRHER